MIQRDFWVNQIENAWKKRTIVWLTGVRRIGKTILTHQLGNITYLNCDRPSVRDELADPEFFLSSVPKDRPIVLDEVHRLSDATTLLKLAADLYGDIRVLATGSSTLAATHAFRDTLAGRKVSVRLFPVLWSERERFDVTSIDDRLLSGGFLRDYSWSDGATVLLPRMA